MEVDRGQEKVELRVCVDPAESQEVARHLSFEELDLIRHIASVLVAFLSWDDQSCDYVCVSNLFAGENGAGFDFD